MYLKEELQALWQSVKALEGTEVSAPEMKLSLDLINNSKGLARTHQWLYHCTNDAAIRSIIQNRELWLSSLKWVNDKEEVTRIDVPQYETSFYVACFTYENNVSLAHWEEYGNLADGVLIGIQPTWLKRKAVFMLGNNQKDTNEHFHIFNTREDALQAKIKEQTENQQIINPYFIFDFGLYQIIYDDVLKRNISGLGEWVIDGESYPGRTMAPQVAGIIKNKTGVCYCPRGPHEKDWCDEKEVRLKMGIEYFGSMDAGDTCSRPYFPKVCVPLTENAFDIVRATPHRAGF